VPSPRLPRLISLLRAHHGAPAAPPVRDPYRLLLLEQVAYLADDDVRLAAFRELERRIGTAPERILAASHAALRAVTRLGGAIAPDRRAQRLRTVAERMATKWDGDLSPVLRLPFIEARRELTRYPSIGVPGAERILLLSGAHGVLALDSNGLRVLLRLGYGTESRQYARAYAAVQEAAERELPRTVAARRSAHLLLRLHGRTLCRTTKPRCGECPLLPHCPAGRAWAGTPMDTRPRTGRRPARRR
jgi:endonuclease III